MVRLWNVDATLDHYRSNAVKALILLAIGAALVYASEAWFQPVGEHAHRCACGNQWQHSGRMRGNKDAHTCAKCGTLVWKQHNRIAELFA